jgi:hypothetical protein
MTRTRKFLVFIASAGLLLAVGLVFLWTNLDWIVKNAIERYGSQALGTAVRVDHVSLSPTKGSGESAGLTIANLHPTSFHSAAFASAFPRVLFLQIS